MVDENTMPNDTPADTPAAVETTSAADEFSAAFAQFASPGEKPDETVSTSEPAAQEAPPADDAGEVEAAPDESAEGAPVAPQPAPEPPRYSAEEWMRVMQAQQQQVPQYDQPAPAPERAPPPPVLSKEEVETIQEFRKEWPDVAKALDVQQKAFANDLLNYVFGQIAQEVAPKLQLVEELTERTHVSDIYDFVPDYDAVREPVINWVGALPNSAFRQYAVSVVEQGSPADIQGLVDQWRMFSGQQAPAPAAPAPVAPPQPQRRQVAPELRRAAAALAPVKSQRTTVVQTEDPDDFDGAFDRYATQARSQRSTFSTRQ